MGMNSGRLWKSTRKRLRAVERRNPYKYKNVGSFNLLPTFFCQKTWIFVRSREGAEQLRIGQDRILHLRSTETAPVLRAASRSRRLAGKDDDLTAVGGGEPFESCFQAIIIVLGKAVVEDQRKTSGFGARTP